MRSFLLSALLLVAASAHSDAVKYREPNGKVLITNQAIEGAKPVSAHRDEYISPAQRQAAIDELQRQREYLQSREQQAQAQSPRSGPAVVVGNHVDKTELHGCLMKVTGTVGLSPTQEAARRVNCFAGTVGLNDDCQRAVASTMRLSSQDEHLYRSYCPR